MEHTNPYEDIINLPRHISKTHPQMPIQNRAAQFAAFAALTGYEDAVKETARLTEKRKELDEYEKALLDRKLKFIMDNIDSRPKLRLTYFIPDSKKDGGAYHTVVGAVKKINTAARTVIMCDNKVIPIDEITDITI